MAVGEISVSITEDITTIDLTQSVTTVNITPSVTEVDVKGISIASASASGIAYGGQSNTLGTGSNVDLALDHINANGFNKTTGGTIAGTATFSGLADFNNTVSFTSNIDTDLALDSTKRITWGSTGGGNLQYKFIKGTNGANLELGTGTTAYMTIANNGNVGIGVAIPTSKLDVNGEITGTALDINGNADVSGSITATSADINGAITAGGDITLDGWPKSEYELKGDVDGSIRFDAIANEDLSKGDVVYIVTHGSQGSETRVAKARADSASTMPAFGLALNDVTSGNAIQVVTFGNLYGQGGGANQLDTSAYDSGTTLYVSADTAGVWTNTPPTGEGNLIQNIGKVVRKQQNNGVIKVGGAGRTNATGNLNDGNIFIGNASNQAVTASFDTTAATFVAGDRTYGNITTTGYLRGPASFTIDPAAHGDNTGTVVIAGNLQVDGTTTTVNSATMTVDDVNITLADGAANAAAADGGGITLAGASATLTYASSTDSWNFNKGLNTTGNSTVTGTFDVTGNTSVTGTIDATSTVTAPTFSGDLSGTINTATTAATQTAGDNTTKVATTAFVTTAISGKVNTTDIVNDLTSTDTDKPLSAAQGKALNDSALQLGTTAGTALEGDTTIPSTVVALSDVPTPTATGQLLVWNNTDSDFDATNDITLDELDITTDITFTSGTTDFIIKKDSDKLTIFSGSTSNKVMTLDSDGNLEVKGDITAFSDFS